MFSTMPVRLTPQLLELPPAWLALLFQHVASGPGGLANAAALGQTCKFLHGLSEGPAVTYRNLFLAALISSPDHPVWQWLARRSGRIAGLSLKLCVTQNVDQLPGWVQRLQTLSSITSVQLRADLLGVLTDLDHSYMGQWLKQHVQLISHLSVNVDVREDNLKLRDFSEAAASCKSIDLALGHYSTQALDLADLEPVAGSLQGLKCYSVFRGHESVRGAGVLNGMTQLTALKLSLLDIGTDELWGLLAKLRGLQGLSLNVRASGDPSPLAALSRLSCLNLHSFELPADNRIPFTFSSLQPLSTLQQLEVLTLWGHACAATSLQGLAGLSNLKALRIEFDADVSRLRTLEGIPTGVKELSISNLAQAHVSLAGIEGCTRLEKLSLSHIDQWSCVQLLGGVSSLKQLEVMSCSLTSLGGLHSMPLESLSLRHCSTLTQLSGFEHVSALERLEIIDCGVTSLQPLSQLGEGLQNLVVFRCEGVQEEVLELPQVQSSASVVVRRSNVREVVLSGGVRLTCIR
jgi:hypothetical protein